MGLIVSAGADAAHVRITEEWQSGSENERASVALGGYILVAQKRMLSDEGDNSGFPSLSRTELRRECGDNFSGLESRSSDSSADSISAGSEAQGEGRKLGTGPLLFTFLL